MNKSFSRLRILLLQARTQADSARQAEIVSFAGRMGLEPEQLVPFDLLSAPPTRAHILRHDALMIGGSGDYYVSRGNLPSFEAVLDALRLVVDAGHPTFASCFGFHLLVQALGGQVAYDPAHMEVGTYTLTLTPAGEEDELFSRLPRSFKAQLGHKDRAERLPPGVVNVASSERVRSQGLRVAGKPIWATQFHPELSGAENAARFRLYLDGYRSVMSPEELQATLDGFAESPDTDALLPGFLHLVFG